MPRTLFYQGSSIATQKKLKITPPEDGYDKPFKIGLGSRLFSFEEFDAEALVTAWNNSEDSLIAEITAAVEDDAVTFTHDTLGQDFELTMQVLQNDEYTEDQLISEIQRLLFQNNCTGGTFTLNFNGETTAAITFNPAAPNTTATNIQNALEAFTGVQVGDIQVTAVTGAAGMSYDLDFSEGQFKGLDVEDVEPDYTNITGGNATAVVALVQDGNAGTNEIHELDMPGYALVEVTQDEIQEVYMTGSPDGGTFTLTIPGYGTTGNLPYNCNRVQLKTAFTALLGSTANFRITGSALPSGRLRVQFVGTLSEVDMPQMTANSAGLTSTAEPDVVIEAVQNGFVGTTPSVTIDNIQDGDAGTLADLTVIPTDAKYTSESNKTASPAGPSAPTDELRVGWDGTSGATSDRFISGFKFTVPGSIILNWIQDPSSRADAFLRVKIKTYDPAHNISLLVFQNVFYSSSSPIGANWSTDAIFWSAEFSNAAAPAGQYFGPNPIYVEPETVSWDDGYVIDIPLEDILDESWGDSVKPYGYGSSVPWPPTFLTDQVLRFILMPQGTTGTSGQFISLYDFDDVTPANRPVLVYGQGVVGAQAEVQRLTVVAASGSVIINVDGDDIDAITVGESATSIAAKVSVTAAGVVGTGGPLGTSAVTLTYPPTLGDVGDMVEVSNTLSGQPSLPEIQDVSITGIAVAGTVTLSVGATELEPISYNASAADVQNAVSIEFPGSVCTGGPLPTKIRVSFPALNGNLGLMTEDNDLVSEDISTVVLTVQDGGTHTVGNVTGGFFDLGIRRSTGSTIWVLDIPWDATAAQMQLAINAALGASSVSCTGGPLPTDAIEITFSGGIYGKHDMRPTLIRTALEGAIAQYENLVTRPHLIPATVDHVYDFAICPGRGTPGLNRRESWKTLQGNCNWGTFTITTPTGGMMETRFRWADCTALDIENALNEMFGCEVCKVYQLYTSQECNERGTGYGLSASYRAWYNSDVYRIVFYGDMVDPASITTFTFSPPASVTLEGGGSPRAIDPREFLDSTAQDVDSGNEDDFYNESYRTYLLFKKADEAEEPLHHFTITPSTVDGTLLGWRYQLLQRYVIGGIYSEGDIGDDAGDQHKKRVVRNALPVDEKISFSWRIVKRSGVLDGTTSLSVFQTLGTTAQIGWDSTAEQIQAALETAFPFMAGNIEVVGSLYNSWLPYGFVADTDESDDQGDLRITFISALHHLPLDEYDYVLGLNVLSSLNGSPTDASLDPNDEYNYPLGYQHVFMRPIPQLRNERQRFTLEDGIEDPLLIGYNGEFASVTKATSIADLQTALNALSTLGSLNLLIGNNYAIPEKFGRSVTVYGTTAGNPFEIEFTGNGFQFSNARRIQLAFEDTDELVYTIDTLQDGIPLRPEIQVLTLTASAYFGTFTLTFSGQTTAAIAYNANAATVQAALIALSNIGPAEVAVTGGPLPITPMVITFAQSLNNVALITTTPTLKNQKIVIDEDNSVEGGQANSLVITEVVRGAGPRYVDTPENYDQNVCISSGDTIIVEGATAPIQFGLNMQVEIVPIGVGVATRFAFTKPRRAFLDGQKVFLRAQSGTLPTGTTARYYFLVEGSTNGTFGLSLTEGGSAIEISDAGATDSVFTLELRELTFRVFARYTGEQIGLPNRRTGGDEEYLACYLRGGFTLLDLGIDEGDGLSLGRFDMMDLTASILVRITNGGQIDNTPAVLFLTDNEDLVYEQREGECGIAFYPEQTSTLKSLKLLGGSLKAGRLTVIDSIQDEDRVGTFTLLEGNLGGVHVHLE